MSASPSAAIPKHCSYGGKPALSDSENIESWTEAGSTDMRRRAYERWNAMLKVYTPPPMDEAVREALEAFVAKRKEELPDAWY